jgi:endonuclease YncB( thermonuclease family)
MTGSAPHRRHRARGLGGGPCRLLSAGAILALAAAPTLALAAQGLPAFAERRIEAPFHAIDGDTFEADLDGNGQIDRPGEQIRLLYVDTPELSESTKGMDPVRGAAAREFLAARLEQGPVALLVPRDEPRDRFGRTLAIVRAGDAELNLLLVREGWSYFDTRFNFPEDYDAYADAEGEAFSARRGIWSDDESRERYLRRLEREWKTPRSPDNPRFGGSFAAKDFDWRKSQGKYVRVQGRMILADGTRPQSVQIRLETPPPQGLVHGVLFHPMTLRLRMTRWPPGSQVVVEGFVRGYRNQPTIIIHYAAPTAPLAGNGHAPAALARRSGASGAPALQNGAVLAMMNARRGAADAVPGPVRGTAITLARMR